MIQVILNMLQWTFIGLFSTVSILAVIVLLFFLFSSQVENLPSEEGKEPLVQDNPRLIKEERWK